MNEWLTPIVDAYLKHFGMSSAPVVWEVGSRDGHDGQELLERISDGWRAVHAGKLVCLEPNPAQANIIRRNYPQSIVYELAAGDETRKAKFKVYHGNEGDVGSSSLHLDWKKGSGLKSHIITVQVVRLEDIIDDEIIDIMAIDTEGYSYEALIGLGGKINQVRALYIETENDSGSNDKVKKYMSLCGFEFVSEAERWGGMPECVFVNPSI